MIRPRTSAAAIVAAVLIASSGCSSSDETSASIDTVAVATDPPVTDPPSSDPPSTDPPSTDPPSTDPPSTDAANTAPRDLSYLWNDLDEMVGQWERAGSQLITLDPDDVVTLVLSVDDFEVAALQSAGDGFAATEVFTAGYLAGTIDPGGEVSALVTTIYPDDEAAGSLLATSLGSVVLPWADLQLDDGEFSAAVGAAYDELTAQAPIVGEQRFVRGPDGLTYVAVLTVIEVEAIGKLAVEVAVIPLPDEEAALAVVELLRLELRAVTE